MAYATVFGAAGAWAHQAHPAQAPASEVLGKTTLEQTIEGDVDVPFSFLRSGPGSPRVVREELADALGGREDRRQSLAYFGQLTDFQISDEESPARVEFVDSSADPPLPDVFNAAWRPQEALIAHGVDLAIRQMNRFLVSPVEQGGGDRARMAFALATGDLADNQQLNETNWVLRLLEGGVLDPNSGSSDPRDYANCPPGTPGVEEAARYTGVQDYDDYVEGNQFYDPEVPVGSWAAWPRYPGLLDQAQLPFAVEGLRVPSYVTFGNHDGLAQGNAAAIKPYEVVGTGCIKPMVPAQKVTEPFAPLDPDYLTSLLTSDPSDVMLVPPDEQRQFVSRRQFKEVFASGRQPDDHGFAFVDPEENRASNFSIAYYAWDALPGLRFISLDTLAESGVPGPSSNGNIDDPQWRWLKRELAKAQAAGKLIVLFGHHPIRSLSVELPDELAPPCTVPDEHGHDVNPGCDLDPRESSPIHTGVELRDLLLAHPNAIAYVAGHTHEHNVEPFERPGGGGFWGIETASLIDWPPQNRLLEVMDNGDGTLSIFGTVLNHAAPIQAPPSGAAASAFGQPELASIGRTLTFNDPQRPAPIGEGTPADRNVELLLPDPRPRTARRRARIRLTVSPPRARRGRRTRFVFRATTVVDGRRRPVRGAVVRFAGERRRTNRRGRAVHVERFRRTGRFRAVATKRGFRRGTARVLVVAPRVRFTG